MPEEITGDLKVGDTVWHFESKRKPPQSKRQVLSITVLDGEAHAGHSAMSVPWTVVRSTPHAVKVELGGEWSWGSQVFPCREPIAETESGGGARRIAVIVAGASGVIALVAAGLFVLVSYGPFAFVLAQVAAASALAVFTKVVWPWLRQ